MAMVEYKHNALVENIREGKATTDIVAFGEEKLYKYENSEPEIVEIRVHLNQISGETSMKGYRRLPNIDLSEEDSKEGLVLSTENPLIFKENLDKPIYIKVKGGSQAVYSLAIQLIHVTEQFVSTITLEEGVKFKAKIKPG
jgi:hypothetical protein